MIQQRAAGAIMGAIMGAVTGGALGFGCHWYYDFDEIRQDCGEWTDLATRFADDYETAVLHAVNGGAQNLSRAMLTGTLVGTQVGLGAYPPAAKAQARSM
ncbi:MAG: ADP-ribosylglycohydrolase family protein [Acidithiobacillus sp.]